MLDAKHVSAWGGLQSAGQVVGMLSLNFAADKLGRKKALYILWVILVGSILAECFAINWKTWIAAKFLAGAGVGMLQVHDALPSSLSTSSFSDIDTPFPCRQPSPSTSSRPQQLSSEERLSTPTRSGSLSDSCCERSHFLWASVLWLTYVAPHSFRSPVVLRELNLSHPLEFRVPIYTQVRTVFLFLTEGSFYLTRQIMWL